MDVNFIHKEGPPNLFHRFSAADYDSVFSFFPARQGSEIFLNESSKSTENALQKNTTKYFLECKVHSKKWRVDSTRKRVKMTRLRVKFSRLRVDF
jgi:hypothetical protein